mmetsp:Transcript_41436/g.39877  ORF Transcript_41436/g.39877 Transcript_41436/m.39877 type:complete len:135 (+) Transcript_41436:157-561(+)
MLLNSGVKKILVCAPSNAAIDEIILRLCKERLLGTTSSEKMKEKLLRIGALDYEPLPQVKQYTLDERVKEIRGVEGRRKNNPTGDRIDRLKEKQGLIITILKLIHDPNNQKRMMDCLKTLFVQSERVQQFLFVP